MLSPSQKQAVCHKNGPCLCLAGPGAGKTTVLTKRIAYLIQEEKVAPEEILVITFTRAAAVEMKERFSSLVEEGALVAFGTFHSVFWKMLREEREYRETELLTGKRKLQILKEVLASCHIQVDAEDGLKTLERELSFLKNSRTEPKDYIQTSFFGEDIIKLWEHYGARLGAYHLMDFDDILCQTLRLLQRDKVFLEKWQRRFRYVLIDEVQDMNALQFAIVRLLALPQNNLFVVGDDDQSIYGFRGGNPKIMLTFSDYYPNAKVVTLQENYRSGREIVASAGRLIRHNSQRLEKSITSVRQEAGVIEVLNFLDESEEAVGVCQTIERLIKNKVAPEQIAVLFRNHAQVAPLAVAMRQCHIPFYTKERFINPYEGGVVLDIMSYFRLTGEVIHRRDIYRVMNWPNRYLARTSVEREWTTFGAWMGYYNDQLWLRERIEALERDVRFFAKLSGQGALLYILKKMGYESYMKEHAKSKEDLEEAKAQLALVQGLVKDTKSPIEALGKWEESHKIAESLQPAAQEEGVALLTLHSSKGLEFEQVFILDVVEGICPSKKADSVEKLEEERRLFYVGMTRAKRKLWLIVTAQMAGDEDKKYRPSRFLTELERR